MEGQNILIEPRWAEGKYDRLPGLATELVRLKIVAFVTYGGVATQAAQQATGTIPIVMAVVQEPVSTGLVASLARPGGNITGMSSALLERASADRPYAGRVSGAIHDQTDDYLHERSPREQRALDVRYELSIMAHKNAMKTRAMKAEALVDSMRGSWSWRMTASLRRLQSAWRRLR